MHKLHLLYFMLFLFDCDAFSQSFSKYILIDQFGYTINANKVAVIRDPQTGYDANETYTSGTTFHLKSVTDNNTIFSGELVKWNNGATDPTSGDKVWYFDFSTVKTEGSFYIEDATTKDRSASFDISDKVYNNVLKTAFKTFFYQRAGFKKDVLFAGEGWADGASHIGTLQDKNCRLYNNKSSVSLERDLSGGWYDAGDYNKYTPWTANYVIAMLNAYTENPDVWTDDFGIPESGNGIPDLIDEIKWGMDWLLKMNQSNGSSLSIVALSHASPPSAAVGQSLYGPATTNATMRSAAAFALGAKIFKEVNSSAFSTYSDTLKARAEKAYTWGLQNPSKIFNNNSQSNGSQGIGAGNQETDSLGRFTAKMGAALYLYELTSSNNYLSEFENGVPKLPLIAWGNYSSQYFQEQQHLLLRYTRLANAKTNLVSQIKNATTAAANKTGDFLDAWNKKTDPYKAFIKDYNWGSNQYKSDYGNFFYAYAEDIDSDENKKAAAEDYIHYIHGVNPFGLVYLTNMGNYGAENNIKEFYHSWFSDGSSKWDREGVSTYGPAPGFLAGGPNQFYAKDGCCPNNCGSAQNNAICNSENMMPPLNQPAMKTYKDFNTSWPLNSWQITENSNGYQVAYLRLLSKFVGKSGSVGTNDVQTQDQLLLFPNPSQSRMSIKANLQGKVKIMVYDIDGKLCLSKVQNIEEDLDISGLKAGNYVLKISQKEKILSTMFIKN